MKKLFALSCTFLLLTMLVPMIGCGGSHSSPSDTDSTPRNAIVVSDGGSRGVQVSWKNPFSSTDNIIQYQIYRAVAPASLPTFPTDTFGSGNGIIYADGSTADITGANPLPAPPVLDYVLVGVADGQATTFIDTTVGRKIEYQNIVPNDVLGNTSYLPKALSAKTTSAEGLKSGDYVYSVRMLNSYQSPLSDSFDLTPVNTITLYNELNLVGRTNKVHFD